MGVDVDRVSDEELAERAKAGDASAFELLVRRHQEAAWRFALAILGSPHDAEEAAQEAFVRAYRGLHSFRAESSFRTWLFTICRRACLDLARHREKVVPLENARREHQAVADLDERHVIETTLAAMPAEERAAFVLVDVLGFSREEAARTESIPASTLKSRLYRARDHLVRALTATDERGEMR